MARRSLVSCIYSRSCMIFSLLLTLYAMFSCSVSSDNHFYSEQHSERIPTRAIWLSWPFWNLNQTEKVNVLDYISSHGINTVYLSVYDSGISRWNSASLQNLGMARGFDIQALKDAVRLIRQHNMEVVAFFEGGLSVRSDKEILRTRPELFQTCGDTIVSGEHGGYYAFLDPASQEVKDIIGRALKELASLPIQFSEIQLDRFRYTHDGNWNICTSYDGQSKPQNVNGLVEYAYNQIKAVRQDIIVSASPVGSYGSWKHLQQWGHWILGGYIDKISTQAYVPGKHEFCSLGSPNARKRMINTTIFGAELASLSGNAQLLKKKISKLIRLGANPGVLELNKRLPMVKRRAELLKKAKEKGIHVPITIGVAAHNFDDSECVLSQLLEAQLQGFEHSSLWVSQVKPEEDGSPNRSIRDNLDLLSETIWSKHR